MKSVIIVATMEIIMVCSAIISLLTAQPLVFISAITILLIFPILAENNQITKYYFATALIIMLILTAWWRIPVEGEVTGGITGAGIEYKGEILIPERDWPNGADFSFGISVYTDHKTTNMTPIVKLYNETEVILNKKMGTVRYDESIKWRYDWLVWGWGYVNIPDDIENGTYLVSIQIEMENNRTTKEYTEEVYVQNGIVIERWD